MGAQLNDWCKQGAPPAFTGIKGEEKDTSELRQEVAHALRRDASESTKTAAATPLKPDAAKPILTPTRWQLAW